MFGFSRPSLPVTPEQRAWIDGRANWIADEFGEARLREVRVIVPTPEFFPDRFDGKESDVLPIFDRVCGYMGVDSNRVDVYLYDDGRPDLGPGFLIQGDRRGAAGLYHGRTDQREQLGIERSNLQDPLSLVATIAHELGHVLLLGDGRISHGAEDHEPLTDLLTVFLGLGVFGANAAVHAANWSRGGWSGWNVGRQGYLSQQTWGYALAKFAMSRGEPKPVWAMHLRPDIRALFKQSV